MKVVVATFKDSMLEQQLLVLERYKMDAEVCVPLYSRLYSRRRNRTDTEGSFD
ncbi:MAG: hypothetical protein ACRDSJ_10270 [Rubrobacteraceae bacterium]